jgi:hypothetical protein
MVVMPSAVRSLRREALEHRPVVHALMAVGSLTSAAVERRM